MKYARMKMNKHSVVSLRRSPVLLFFCMALIAAALPESTQAQEWRIEPIVKFGGEFDDNARLNSRTDLEIELAGFLVDLSANIKYSSARTSFFIEPQVLIRNYPDEPDFDSDDYFLRSQFSHKGQLSTVGFRVSFDQQTIRTAERAISDIDVDDPVEITDDDTGRILLSGERSKWQLSPYWDYQLSNVSSICVGLDYFNVDYEDVFAGLLADYTDARVSLNYRRNFSSVLAGLLTVTGRKYDSAAALGDTSGYGLQVGFERALSEKMHLTAMVGMEDTDQEGVETDPEVVGNVTLIRNMETIRMFVQYRRSVVASGAGRLDVRDALNFNFRRRLNEKISAGLGVRAYQTRGVGGAATIDDRNYIQLQSTFRWYLATSYVIEASYRYTIIDRSEAIGQRANSNQINLWFTYQPKTIPKL